MQLRLLPRRRSDAAGVTMENTRLHDFKLVRPARTFSVGMKKALDLLIEIEAMVVTPA